MTSLSIVLDLIEAEGDAIDTGDAVSVADLRAQYHRLADSEKPDFQQLLSLGQSFEEAGLADEAIPCYSRVIALDGSHAEALARRGNVSFSLFIARDVDGSERELVRWAVSDFEKAVQSAGKNLGYARMLGLALLMLGNYERARKLCETTLVDCDADVEASWDFLYVLGYSQLFAGQVEEALMSFGRLSQQAAVLDDGWLGQALCFRSMGLADSISEVRGNLSALGNERLSFLLERGADNYLEVARALL
jgi:tetratricopeptide (TPR) repeat protein